MHREPNRVLMSLWYAVPRAAAAVLAERSLAIMFVLRATYCGYVRGCRPCAARRPPAYQCQIRGDADGSDCRLASQLFIIFQQRMLLR